jgi:hypothetical protein
MRSTLGKYVWLAFLLLPLLCSSSWADGKIFSRALTVPLTTPDQRAMLQFSNGVERLVIETSFVGEGTNFAWVVPFPSAPQIEAVSTNFFAYLNLAYQPKLILLSPDRWVFFLLIGYVVAISVWSYRCQGRRRLVTWIGLMIFALGFIFLSLPSFIVARGFTGAIPANSIKVLKTQNVGVYNTTTIQGTNGTELLSWLNAHGFRTPKLALPIISSYAAQGWVFVAATINRDAAGASGSRPHPLGFTFKCEKPVYPLRLTGIENPRCRIELFVFGPDRAEAPGFQVEYCGKPSSILIDSNNDFTRVPELFAASQPGDFKIGNSELQNYVFPAEVTTKLTGTLKSQDMQSDAWISWTPFKTVFPTFRSRGAAISNAFDWIAGIVIPGFLALQILSPHLKRKNLLRIGGIVLLLAIVCGVIRYSTIDSTKIVYHRGGWFAAANSVRTLDYAILEFDLSRTNSHSPTADEWLDAINKNGKPEIKNAFTGQPLRYEATPGNIIVQTSTNGVKFFWYDIQGMPHEVEDVPNKAFH